MGIPRKVVISFSCAEMLKAQSTITNIETSFFINFHIIFLCKFTKKRANFKAFSYFYSFARLIRSLM